MAMAHTIHSHTGYTAFDYDAQVWVTGEPARLLLVEQSREHLKLLQSEGGSDYFFGTTGGSPGPKVLEAAISEAKRVLADFTAGE